MRRLLAILALMTLALMFGAACDRSPSEPRNVLRVSLSGPDAIAPGEVATFTLAVTNTSSRRVVFETGGEANAFDVIVRSMAGAVVWRRLSGVQLDHGALFALAAGEEITFDATWNLRDQAGAPVPAGQYTVQGLLMLASKDPEAAPETLTLTLLP